MFEWVGSLRLREHTPMRVQLSLARGTRLIGLALLVAGIYLAMMAMPVSRWLVVLPAIVIGLGAALASLHRELVFDRADGVLRIDQRTLGIPSRTVVPLFHLRAVVIIARPDSSMGRFGVMSPSKYVAYVDRRVGDAIYLDEARRCAGLLRMAEAIADVAELRLEYDAMSQAGNS
jgi:hypothetical protein